MGLVYSSVVAAPLGEVFASHGRARAFVGLSAPWLPARVDAAADSQRDGQSSRVVWHGSRRTRATDSNLRVGSLPRTWTVPKSLTLSKRRYPGGSCSIVVDAPVDAADFGHTAQSESGTLSYERVDTSALTVGARWHNVSEFRGRRTELTHRLTRLEPDRSTFPELSARLGGCGAA